MRVKQGYLTWSVLFIEHDILAFISKMDMVRFAGMVCAVQSSMNVQY